MLRHNTAVRGNEMGYTIIELLIAMSMAVLLGLVFYTFFKTSMVQYLNLQKDGSSSTTLAAQATRVANVLRGLTGIVSANSNDLVVYAYFYPSDSYVSQLHYYIVSGQLLADLTKMTANPPTGTLVPGSTKTYTIIPNFYQATGTSLFAYYDGANALLTVPISDTNTIKSIQVNLGATLAAGGNQSMSLQVDLRNRKTNL